MTAGGHTSARCLVALAGLLASRAPAWADHDHAAMMASSETGVSAQVALEAAQYSNISYIGSYQGVMPSLGWSGDRFGVNAMLGLYHLEKNGLSIYGIGDAMFTGNATLITSEAVRGGLALHMMVPTGSELDGLGMGHVMAMPSAWAAWHADRLTLSASAGYSRALTSLGGEQHNHGPQPLVDPMNMQEITWSAAADVDLVHDIRLGARAGGGLAIGTGQDRVFGAGRVAWGTPRMSTAFELQFGIAGDPFTIRGVLETALRF